MRRGAIEAIFTACGCQQLEAHTDEEAGGILHTGVMQCQQFLEKAEAVLGLG